MPESKHWSSSPFNWVMRKLGALIVEGNSLKRAYQVCMRILWHLTGICCLVYSIAVPVLMAIITNKAETTWWSACAIYLPWGIWLTPVVILVPMALLFRPVALLPLLIPVCSTIWYLDIRWPSGKRPPDDAWRFLTVSFGQRRPQGVFDLIEKSHPELVVTQESANFRGYRIRPDRYNQCREHEFQLLSEFTISDQEPITFTELHPLPIALRCVLTDTKGRSFVVYNVHLPTPRRDFRILCGRDQWLKSLLKGEGVWDAQNRDAFMCLMQTRDQLIEHLLARIREETLPVLAMGDFNVPRRSKAYRLITDELSDMHKQVGTGTGNTFPGYTLHPLGLFMPWLRLDYVFLDEHWEPFYYVTEDSREPQHLSVIVSLRLRDSPDSPGKSPSPVATDDR